MYSDSEQSANAVHIPGRLGCDFRAGSQKPLGMIEQINHSLFYVVPPQYDGIFPECR